MSFGLTSEQVRVQFDDTPPGTPRYEPTGRDHRPYASSIGAMSNGVRPYTLHVRGFIEPYAPGNHVFDDQDAQGNEVQHHVTIHPLSRAEITDFQNKATADVRRVWNDKLWLTAVDITRGYRDLGEAVPPPLVCRIELSWVDEPGDAHLHLVLLKSATHGLPRSNCWRGGASWWSDAGAYIVGDGNAVDMVMHTYQAGSQQTNTRPVDPGGPNVTEHQSVFAHEFGHYVGLGHPFAGHSGVAPNSDPEYGIGMGNEALFRYVMGVGETILTRAAYPWNRHLSHHRYFPSRTFRPTVQEPPQVSMLRTVRIRTAE